MQTARWGEPGRSRLHWHGGEPLLLPLEYFDSVMRLENEIFGSRWLESRRLVNYLQTNLYSLPEAKLDFLQRNRFEAGVSLDVVEGQRLTISGAATQEQVVANMKRLRERSIPHSGAVVLAGHTKSRLNDIYDFYEDLGVRLTIFPLSASPLNVAGADFALAESEIIEALKGLFVHWVEQGARIAVQPLKTYLETAILHITGLARRPYDRRKSAERLLVVDTDGHLYTLADRYAPEMVVGNIFETSLDDILASPTYAASLERDSQRREKHCDGCSYRGACDTYPLFSEVYRAGSRRCRTAFELIGFIETYLQHAGFNETELKDLVWDNSVFAPTSRKDFWARAISV